MGSTDFDRQLKYNWALQGELVRTIRQLNEIADARVHIVQTGQSLFVGGGAACHCLGFLKVKPMKSLEREQIQAIANLVAGSVKGLKPENVTILEQYGRLLSEEMDLGSDPFKNKAVAGQLELKPITNGNWSGASIHAGAGLRPRKAVARVNAELDFDWSESNLETYEAGCRLTTSGLVKRRRTEEIFQGQGSALGTGRRGFTFPATLPEMKALPITRKRTLYSTS